MNDQNTNPYDDFHAKQKTLTFTKIRDNAQSRKRKRRQKSTKKKRDVGHLLQNLARRLSESNQSITFNTTKLGSRKISRIIVDMNEKAGSSFYVSTFRELKYSSNVYNNFMFNIFTEYDMSRMKTIPVFINSTTSSGRRPRMPQIMNSFRYKEITTLKKVTERFNEGKYFISTHNVEYKHPFDYSLAERQNWKSFRKLYKNHTRDLSCYIYVGDEPYEKAIEYIKAIHNGEVALNHYRSKDNNSVLLSDFIVVKFTYFSSYGVWRSEDEEENIDNSKNFLTLIQSSISPVDPDDPNNGCYHIYTHDLLYDVYNNQSYLIENYRSINPVERIPKRSRSSYLERLRLLLDESIRYHRYRVNSRNQITHSIEAIDSISAAYNVVERNTSIMPITEFTESKRSKKQKKNPLYILHEFMWNMHHHTRLQLKASVFPKSKLSKYLLSIDAYFNLEDYRAKSMFGKPSEKYQEKTKEVVVDIPTLYEPK